MGTSSFQPAAHTGETTSSLMISAVPLVWGGKSYCVTWLKNKKL